MGKNYFIGRNYKYKNKNGGMKNGKACYFMEA